MPVELKSEEKLFDVVMVNLNTNKVKVITEKKTAKNAEAIINMTVARRGVEENFYVDVITGTYKDGDVYQGQGE